jgi:hypothetical protein
MTRPGAWCLRIAGASGIVNGLGFGGFAIPAIVSVGQGHGIIYTFGNPTYGNGPFERIGVPTTVPLLAAFLAACVVQVVGGVLLLWPRPSGIVVTVVGMLLGAPFWWGFDLPFAWLNAAVVLAFLILAWAVQKESSRSPSGGGRSSA